jgi:multicomponent Na+:H+ antiporter subunit B
VSRRVRVGAFGVAAVGLAALLVWALRGLPAFGHPHPQVPYAATVNHVAVPQRGATNVVMAVTFDYRGLDTLGEEFILFAAAVATTLLLRVQRTEEEGPEDDPHGRDTSDALRALGVALVGPAVLLGLYVISHGQLTPGGGFQGGVVVSAGILLVFVAGSSVALRRISPLPLVEATEAVAAGALALMAVGGLIFGVAFFFNFLPQGSPGSLLSGGTIALGSLAVGFEVAGAFTLILTEFVDQRTVHMRMTER